MFGTLRAALMSPLTGPIATGIALALAAALGVSASARDAERAAYEARIETLQAQAERTREGLKAELATCHALRAARPAGADGPAGEPSDGARRLLQQQPEGIDACARMESADRAVLGNLRK